MHGDPELGPEVSRETFCMIISFQLAPDMAEVHPSSFHAAVTLASSVSMGYGPHLQREESERRSGFAQRQLHF